MYIINLTTTSGRLDLCSATVWSLLEQSLTPGQINIWISRDAYLADEGISNDPYWVEKFNGIRNIIKVNYVKNTGPYRKIIPALRKATDEDILIYADDDVIYARGWLEKMINCYINYNGNNVVATRIRYKKKNFLSLYQSYNMFEVCNKTQIFEKDFIITGVGGCVLAKKHLKSTLMNLEQYNELAPKTDDLWISKIIELSGTSVVCCSEALMDVQEITHGKNALNHENTLKSTGGLIYKVSTKIFFKICGYLGVSLSNNDKSMRKIDDFFKTFKWN